MKTATVADLRNNFARISEWINDGETITITRRRQTFATLQPATRKHQKVEWPDFKARLDRRFPKGPPPGKPLSEIVDEGRGEW